MGLVGDRLEGEAVGSLLSLFEMAVIGVGKVGFS